MQKRHFDCLQLKNVTCLRQQKDVTLHEQRSRASLGYGLSREEV
jgi:hypothetical protein